MNFKKQKIEYIKKINLAFSLKKKLPTKGPNNDSLRWNHLMNKVKVNRRPVYDFMRVCILLC